MILYQVLDAFINSISHSSLFSVWEQTKTCSYEELIGFFKEEYLSQDLILESKDKLFNVNDGYLVLDEIVLSKSKAGKHKFVKKRYKSAGGYVVPGVSIVVLVWTNGKVRVPLRFRIQLNGEKHTESALYLISWYRNKISKRIKYITFDSAFASEKVLKRLNDYCWCFVTRIAKTRKFNDKQAKKAHRGGYYTKEGEIQGLRVKVVRRKEKFFVTNRLGMNSKKIVQIYGERAIIEEIFRVLKQECHWSRCQLREHEHYENYYIIGVINFMLLEYLRLKGFGDTIYRIRRDILLGQLEVDMSYFKSLLA